MVSAENQTLKGENRQHNNIHSTETAVLVQVAHLGLCLYRVHRV